MFIQTYVLLATDTYFADTFDKINDAAFLLIVEDDDLVRETVALMLSDVYPVIEAASAEDAISILEKRTDIIGVLTDNMTPGMSGLALSDVVRKRWNLPILIMTGVPLAVSGMKIVQKPVKLNDLIDAVTRVVGRG